MFRGKDPMLTETPHFFLEAVDVPHDQEHTVNGVFYWNCSDSEIHVLLVVVDYYGDGG